MIRVHNWFDDMQSKTDIISSNSLSENENSNKLSENEKFSEIIKRLDKFAQWVFELEDF